MLFVFHLSWPDYDVNAPISEANHRLETLAKAEGLDHRVQFNCASLQGGEVLIGTPGARDQDEQIDRLRFDSMRRFYERELKILGKDRTYVTYKELGTSLKTLRRDGHAVSAVGLYPRKSVEVMLEEGRIRDFFEDAVFGLESLEKWVPDDTSLGMICMAAFKAGKAPRDESVVVSDTAEGVRTAKMLHPRSVVGYVPSYVGYLENGPSIRKLEKAGADITVSNEVDLASIPWLLTGQSQSQRMKHRIDMNMVFGPARK